MDAAWLDAGGAVADFPALSLLCWGTGGEKVTATDVSACLADALSLLSVVLCCGLQNSAAISSADFFDRNEGGRGGGGNANYDPSDLLGNLSVSVCSLCAVGACSSPTPPSLSCIISELCCGKEEPARCLSWRAP